MGTLLNYFLSNQQQVAIGFTIVATQPSQKPTTGQLAGMAWWNNLSPDARRFWIEEASCGRRLWDVSPADAWEAFKGVQEGLRAEREYQR